MFGGLHVSVLAIHGVREATDLWPGGRLSRAPATARKSRGGMSYARRNAWLKAAALLNPSQ